MLAYRLLVHHNLSSAMHRSSLAPISVNVGHIDQEISLKNIS
jgi:hypothetical protein